MVRMMCALMALFVAGVACAQVEDAALRTEIQKLYRQVDQIAVKMDAEAMLALLHPNYVMISADGSSMNKKQMREFCDSMKGTMKDVKSTCTLKHVQSGGNEVTAWIEMVMEYSVKSGSRWTKMKSTHRIAETIVKTDKGWIFTMSQELPINEPWPFK